MMEVVVKSVQVVLTRDSEDRFSVKLSDHEGSKLEGGDWDDLYVGVHDSIDIDIPSILMARDELGAHRTLTIKLNGKAI